ncbi:hypothetical protein KPH14_008886 [Odynerus spinipes]|uniref:G-protein coupled receptors family 1 profile domain-containing protein n=1 Tax=Odynerus spinipes TaxID=1348599 RepID=A0AAD9RGC6_9HYME|nr:hypothetical protein KPH14_008886 [Odynerus spinipes]
MPENTVCLSATKNMCNQFNNAMLTNKDQEEIRFNAIYDIDCPREQFPISLAYAITIHKSQGHVNLESALLDIGSSIFSRGRAYVALSRVKSIEGVHIINFDPSQIKAQEGNAFLVNVALADLLVTGLVIPVSMIVILAGHEESLGTCRFEGTLEALCFLVTVLTLTTIAAENYARLCLPPERYNVLTASRVTVTIITIWLIAVIAVVLQSSLDVGPDFCQRKFGGIAVEQVVGVTILVGLPTLTTTLLYAKLVLCVRRATRGSYKPPIAFSWDYELTKANIYSCLIFLIFWLPFGIAVCVNSFTPISAHYLYSLAWFAFSKSCFNNLLYCVADRHFRSAYVKLFHYCCCKTTVNFSRRTRADAARNSSDVRLRVHIIHSYASPASCRPTVARPNGREVYEL